MTSDENEQVVGDLESSTTCSRIWAQIQKLENAVSAIHAQVSASYVRGCVAGEEQDRVGDFVVGAEPCMGTTSCIASWPAMSIRALKNTGPS